MKKFIVAAIFVAAIHVDAQDILRPAGRDSATEEPSPRIARRTLEQPIRYSGSKVDAARAFLNRANGFDLAHSGTQQIGSRSYVRLQQRLNGIPVRGATAVVQVDQDNSIGAVNSKLDSRLVVSGEWNVDQNAALATVAQEGTKISIERLYILRSGKAVPAWRIAVRTDKGPQEFIVSAVDGSVLEMQSLRMGDRAQGFAFPTSPLQGDPVEVTLENLTSESRLTGEQTKIFSYLPALRGDVAPNNVVQFATRTNGNFLFPANDPRFSEVQLYHGMERANARFKALGFPGFSEALPGVVYWQDFDKESGRFIGADNAFFTPMDLSPNGGMFFYLTRRGNDTALDTDIIFHEYAHAIVNYIVGPFQSTGFKALNEGTADYFSDSFLDDPVMGEFAAKIFQMRSSFLRRADNVNKWPFNTVGEVHADGNIWAGALWDIRSSFGSAVADEIAVNALLLLSPESEFFEAASAAVDAADSLFGGSVSARVEEIMSARGILSSAARTASNSITLGSGESAQGSISAASPGRLLVASQQYRIDVPNRSTRLRINLSGTSDLRFYIRYRVPITIEDGFIVAEQVSRTGTNVTGSLTLESTPELQAGTYYIAVVNTAGSPADYTLEASVVKGDGGSAPAFTLLTDGETAPGSAPSGPFLASRQFAIDVPEGATAVRATLDGDQDVDLYARIGAPVFVNNTGFPEADLISDSPSSSEQMTLTRSGGGTLPAGRYFFAVYNYSGETTRYSIRLSVER